MKGLAVIQVKVFLPPRTRSQLVTYLGPIVSRCTDIIRLFCVMFTVLIDQIKHLDNFSI